MNLLEYYQNQQPNNEYFVQRKCQIPQNTDINLYGARGTGKTTLVLDYLNQLPNEATLYIDFHNPNLIFNTIGTKELQLFIAENKIQYLVLDHYQKGLLSIFPKVEQLIVITRTPLELFESIELFPLDYEEFLAFEVNATQNRGLKHFLRSGSLPALAHSNKSENQVMQTFFYANFNAQEQKLMLILAQHHTKHLSIHQLYTFAKEKFKVSKDWLYKSIKSFQEEKLLFFLEDRYEKSGKKMLLFDFAFAKYLTIGQPFILQFDTMVALALIKHSISVETLGIHGYVTQQQTLIIPAPFESEESLWVKSQKKFSLYKQHGIKKVTIVTVTNTYEYHIEKLHFEALPFDEWSVINDEEEI